MIFVKKSITYVLLLVGLNSCIYKNSEVFINPIQPPTATTDAAKIDLNNVVTPVLIHKPTTFSFSVTPTNRSDYRAKIKIDDTQRFDLKSSTGTFYFTVDPLLVGNGDKKVSVEVTYLSKSNSLSGQLGLETLTFSREWAISVDIVPPNMLSRPNVYLADGRSMIAWSSPNRFSFLELIILRRYLDKLGSVLKTDSIKISDLRTTSFHDASYVGGPVTYRIDLKGYKFYVQGQETTFNVTPLSYVLDPMASIPKLNWEKSPLYNNDITILLGGEFRPDLPGSSSFDVRFGQPDYTYLRIKANNPPPGFLGQYIFEEKIVIYKGIKVPQINAVVFLSSENSYLIVSGNSTLYKIDATTLQISGSLALNTSNFLRLVSSENDQFIYLQSGTTLTRVSSNLNIIYSVDLVNILGSRPQDLFVTSLSNDNIVAIKLMGTSLREDNIAIDLNQNKTVWKQVANYRAQPMISPNGEYIYLDGALYNKANWSVPLGVLTGSNASSSVFFRQGGYNQLFVDQYGGVGSYVYDLNLPPTNGQFNPIESVPSYKYDRFTDSFFNLKILYPTNYLAEGYVFEGVNLAQVRFFDLIFSETNFDNVKYLNGHLFHFSGFYLP
jgi:hypothetical protein